MPFVGGDDSPPPARNKRRWHNDDEDDDTRGVLALFRTDDTCPFGGNYPLSARRMAAPISKRTRFDSNDNDNDASHDLTPSHRRRLSQQPQRQKTPQSTPAAAPPRPAKNAVAPCHICHRRPTKKSDLDSFARCEGCGAQTCFVCIRQCHGRRGDMASVLSEQEALSRSFHMEDAGDEDAPAPADPDGQPPPPPPQERTRQSQDAAKDWAACGHRSVVCSRCCVEKGPEGEVVCLGCLFGDEAPEDMSF